METWSQQHDVMLKAAEEVDRTERPLQTDRAPILELIKVLEKEYRRIWTQDGVPQSLELDVLAAWALKRGMRKPLRIKDINDILREEIRTLLWVYTFGPFVCFENEIARAKEFCLMLHRAALAHILEEDKRRIA